MIKSMIKNKPGLVLGLAVVLSTVVLTSHFLHGTLFAAGPRLKYDTPTITVVATTQNTIELSICAGATGAPAGFSVQWMKAVDYYGKESYDPTIDVGAWNGDLSCHASFSGNANDTNWNLAPNSCVDVVIGGLNDADPGVSFSCTGPLVCDTGYVFRVFAHASSDYQRSAFSTPVYFETSPCGDTFLADCDFRTKSHGFYGGNGAAGLTFLLDFLGGNGGTGLTANFVGTGNMLTIGDPAGYTYSWVLTGTYTDVDKSPNYQWVDNGLLILRDAISTPGGAGQFSVSATNSTTMGTGGNLAAQAATLTITIAASGNYPNFPAGFGDLVLRFTAGSTYSNNGTDLTAEQTAALNGQSINQVLQQTNLYLAGGPLPYSLTTAGQLNELVSQLNLSFHVSENGDDCGISAFGLAHLARP